MATKLKGLGRGLDALLMPEPAKLNAPIGGNGSNTNGLASMKLSELHAGKYQPRKRFEDASLTELSASIKAQGIMQPIVVRKTPAGTHEIIAGERRFRAAQLAGLVEVPVIVREVDDKTALTLALIENLQRQDLNAIEEALGLQRLIHEFKFTHEQAADAVGKSRSAVTNLLRLLELAQPVQDRVVAGTLEMGHARALASLPKDKQVMLAEKIAINALSVRATEAMVKEESELLAAGGLKTKPTKASKGQRIAPEDAMRDSDLDRLENDLSDALGTYVEIVHSKEGKGEVIIRYASLEQLDGILDRVKRK